MPTSFVDAPGTFRPMIWLTLPVLAEQVLHLLVGFTDLWLTGNYLQNEAYVAAMALMIYTLWLTGNVFNFVGARFHGIGGAVCGCARSCHGRPCDEPIDHDRFHLVALVDRLHAAVGGVLSASDGTRRPGGRGGPPVLGD